MVQIGYVNKPVANGEIMWIYGSDLNSSSTEIFFKSTFTNELIDTHTYASTTVTNEARRRSIVQDYIDNGYNIQPFDGSSGKTTVSRFSIHSNEVISFRNVANKDLAQNQVPYWVTTNGRSQASSGYIVNQPEIWGVEASNLPSTKKWSPDQEFLIYGTCLSDYRDDFPSIWILPSGQPSSAIVKIDAVDYSFGNADARESSQFVTMARLRKTAAPAILNTTAADNEGKISLVSILNTSAGNNDRVSFVYGTGLSIAWSGNGPGLDYLVTVQSGITKASSVIYSINNDVLMPYSMRAFNYYKSSGTGFVSNFSYLNLSGGQDASGVASGTYYLYTSSDRTVYGVAGYNRPFKVDNQPEQFHYVYGSGFSYWNTGTPSGFILTDTASINEQTKVMQTLMMRAQQLQQTGVPSRRVKIVIPNGHYIVDRPITPPPSSVLDNGICGSLTIEADSSKEFYNVNVGSDFPPGPNGFTNTFSVYERPLINLQGYSDICNMTLIGSRDHIPQYRPPSALVMFYLAGHNSVENLKMEHDALCEEKWSNFSPCCFMMTGGSSYNKIRNIEAQSLTFQEFVSGTSKYHTYDNIKVVSPHKHPNFGSVGRLGLGECVIKNVAWENMYRGITDTGRTSMERYRNLYFQCSTRHAAYNTAGSEQLLWEGSGFPMENVSQSGLFLIGRSYMEGTTPLANSFFAAINSGVGVGQYRRITAVSGSYNSSDATKKWYFTLEQPWLVNPTASSTVLVGQFTVENVVSRFKADHCARAIILYGMCISTAIVESDFNSVENAIWLQGRRVNHNSNATDRIDSNLHTYIGYNTFIDCSESVSYTTLDYGTGGFLAGTFRKDPICVGLYCVQNSFDNSSLQFGSSAVVTEPDFTCMSFAYNSFDNGFFPSKREWGNVGRSEFIYGLPRTMNKPAIGIGGTNKAWPVREHANIVYGQQLTTSDTTTSGQDKQKAMAVGGSTHLWGQEYVQADLQGLTCSTLMRPSGYPYYNGTDNAQELIRTVQSPTGIITGPDVCNIFVTTNDWSSVISQIQADIDILQTSASGSIIYESHLTANDPRYRITYQRQIGPISTKDV